MALLATPDLKHALRKLEFPFSAREALDRAEQLCISTDPYVNTFPLDLIQELIAEFVFCEVDKRGIKKRKLNAITELSLLEVLCDHFSKASPNNVCAARNTLFLWLFHPASEGRIPVLAKLVSLAISTRRVSVLSTAGLWMQCTLPDSPQSTTQLATMLVKDFFVLTPLAVNKLRELPQLAPLFTANLLTAFSQMYGPKPGESFVPPPLSMLEVATQWVLDHPDLCITPLLQPGPGSSGADPITPVAGLARWCILSPLNCPKDCKDDGENTRIIKKQCSVLSSLDKENKLYSSLHLSLLQGLLCPMSRAVPGRRESAMATSELSALADELNLALRSNSLDVPEDCKLLALDRLGQIVQTGLMMAHIYGTTQTLIDKLDLLPSTRLIKIIMKKYLTLPIYH